jgi:predicted DsbA family dithiol-disulfide isomerase
MTVRIDVISDVVCPWCFIGQRRLARALELLREGADEAPEVEVVWHPFQLNPQLPLEGVERSEYVALKFGSRGQEIYGRVAAVGRGVGIDFAFDRIVRQPNTVPAHQLIDLAQQQGRQDEMVEALFRGYFLDGVDLTQAGNLVVLAAQAGLEPGMTRACLEDSKQRQAVLDADARARALGVSGVPFFIFGQRLAVSGAQEPEVLLRALAEAAAEPAAQDSRARALSGGARTVLEFRRALG